MNDRNTPSGSRLHASAEEEQEKALGISTPKERESLLSGEGLDPIRCGLCVWFSHIMALQNFC